MSFAIFKMLAPSPPTLPAIPSLAELQKHAEALTSSLPSYSSYSSPANAPLDTSSSAVVKSKPIPMVNIHPKGIITRVNKEEEDKGWLSGIASLGGWNASPPPSYKFAQEPLALTHKQLREEMKVDRKVEADTGGAGDVDQGRQVLSNMRKGFNRLGEKRHVQSGIPGEEPGQVKERVVRRDRWGWEVGKNNQPLIGDMVRKDFSSSRPQEKSWIRWVRCGA